MKKLITILLLLLSFGASAQFVNTTTVGSKSTLFKSLGGISADSAVIVLGSFTDTAAANYSVASKYNSIIRVGTSYWYRTLSPDKWNQFTANLSGVYVAIADTANMLSHYPNYTATNSMLALKMSASDTTNKWIGIGWMPDIARLTDPQTLTNKTIAAGSNTITGLTNANLSGAAGITNANLQNSSISGIQLGSNLNNHTVGWGLIGSSYNGSTALSWNLDTTAFHAATKTDLLSYMKFSDTAAALGSHYYNKTYIDANLATKQGLLTLTTTGTSGAATLVGNTLNIPSYSAGTGTVTSVAALTLGTTGTDLSSTVANSTTTPVITLNVPTASATNRGVLSTTDWTTFNNKQSALTFNNGLTNTAGAVGLGGTLSANTTVDAAGYVLSLTGGTTVALNANNIPIRSTSYLTTTGTETIQLATSGVYGGLHIDIASGSFTPFSTSKHAALSGIVYKTSAGNFSGILPAVFGTVEFSGTGNVTTAVAVRAFYPTLTSLATYSGAITNAVGVYIDDIGSSSVLAQITNRYAIWQVGTGDTNLFAGKVMMTSLPTYADNTAAASLPTGQLYKDSTGIVRVKY